MRQRGIGGWPGRLLAAGLAAAALVGPAGAAASSAPVEGRAWELITPSQAISAMVYDAITVSDDGRRVLYFTLGPLPNAPSGDYLAHNIAVRSAEGWQTEAIGSPYLSVKLPALFSPFLVGYNRDLTGAILGSVAPLLPGAPQEGTTGFYRWTESGGLTLIGGAGEAPSPKGVSGDLQRVVFADSAHLLPSDAGRTQGKSVYEFVGTTLRQIDLDSDGSLLSACGSAVAEDGVSESAERVYLVNPAEAGSCGIAPRLFLREGDETTEVSASRCSEDCGAAAPATFLGATPTGSTAFFASAQRLVNADENQKVDLYRFTAADGEIELVSPGSAGMEGEVSLNPVSASANGSVVYFYSNGPLLPGQGEAGANLYVAGPDGVHLVAAVGASDPLEVSSSGDVAAFSTAKALDLSDTDTSIDTYVYDRQAGTLAVASHGPTGGNGAFDAGMEPPIDPGPDRTDRNNLAADGSRVFFSTSESLVPEDTDGALDAYEWTAAGLALISPGSGSTEAAFVGADANGQTVVIRTAAALLPSDRDGGDVDLYAGRPGGGFEESGGEAAPACAACGESPSPALRRPTAASEGGIPAKNGGLRFGRLGPDACGGLRNGELTVLALVSRPGRVTAVARGRLAGRRQALMRGAADAAARGKVRVRLVAEASARSALSRRGSVELRVVLRQAGAVLSRMVTLRCGGRNR